MNNLLGLHRSRRRFLQGAAAASAALVLSTGAIGRVGATGEMAQDKFQGRQVDDHGRVFLRPGQPVEDGPRGLHPLRLESGRDGLIYVPDSYRADTPAPLVLMLHGSGGDAKNGIDPFLGFADDNGCILLAPASRDATTWDLVLNGFGPDITFIARALAQTFSRYTIDPAHLAIEGFSDGASYALSMGATNGDLFTHLIAFSPGVFMPEEQHGWPIVYDAHGTADTILPINQSSRKIVPKMRNTGYDVHYHEFDGPHTVLPEIAREALDWFLPKGK